MALALDANCAKEVHSYWAANLQVEAKKYLTCSGSTNVR